MHTIQLSESLSWRASLSFGIGGWAAGMEGVGLVGGGSLPGDVDGAGVAGSGVGEVVGRSG